MLCTGASMPAPRAAESYLSKKSSSRYLERFFYQMKSERLVSLRPRKRGVRIGNITPLLQKVKFRAQTVGGDLREGTIEEMNLLGETGSIAGIGEKPLAIRDR